MLPFAGKSRHHRCQAASSLFFAALSSGFSSRYSCIKHFIHIFRGWGLDRITSTATSKSFFPGDERYSAAEFPGRCSASQSGVEGVEHSRRRVQFPAEAYALKRRRQFSPCQFGIYSSSHIVYRRCLSSAVAGYPTSAVFRRTIPDGDISSSIDAEFFRLQQP